MPRVKFTADYDFKPKPQVTIAYKADWSGMVTTPCAEAAIAAGKALRVTKVKEGDDGGRTTEASDALSETG